MDRNNISLFADINVIGLNQMGSLSFPDPDWLMFETEDKIMKPYFEVFLL